MPQFIRVASTTDLAPGEARCVEVAGKKIALFNLEGSFYAIDDTCTHRGGPLSDSGFALLGSSSARGSLRLAEEGDNIWQVIEPTGGSQNIDRPEDALGGPEHVGEGRRRSRCVTRWP